MSTLLHIDASARKTRSLSRALGKAFIDQWLEQHPADAVTHRDVGTNPPNFISEDWIAAVFTDEEKLSDDQKQLLEQSDLYIEELSRAEVIVVSTPMYNYGMPAALKAWFDQVIRVNKTFSFDLSRGDYPLEPILKNKKLVLLTASGEFGFAQGGQRESMNHLGPHIKTLSKYLGVDEIAEIEIEYQEFGDERHTQSIEKAYAAIPEVIERLSKK